MKNKNSAPKILKREGKTSFPLKARKKF